MRRLVFAVAAGILMAGCSSADQPVESEPAESDSATPEVEQTLSIDASVVTLNGMAIVEKELDGAVSTGCENLTGKFGALGTGMQLKLVNASGDVIAVSELGPSQLDPPENICAWDASFDDVPAGEKFYSTSIGEWESPAYAEDDLPPGRIVINAE